MTNAQTMIPSLTPLFTPIAGGGGGEDPKELPDVDRKMIDKLLSGRLAIDKKTARDVIESASKKAGIPSDFLAASALQEGMNLAITSPEDASQAYSNAKVDQKQFPVDGFYNYGLDTFGDAYKKLQKKGYLPADFTFKPYTAYNEQGKLVNTAAFRNNEEALMAKAAYLRDFMDNVQDEAKKKGVKLADRELKYFTMAAYNGGIGSVKDMFDEMIAAKQESSEYIKNGSKKRAQVHKNVSPRMSKMDYFSKIFNTKTQ